MTDLQWQEVTCQRDVSGASFGKGVQDFIFSCGGVNAFSPADSYFRMQLTVTGANGLQAPQISEQIALAENCVANMYVNAFFRIGGQDVSTVISYLPQISSLLARVNTSGSLNKTIGSSCRALSGSFSERCAAISTSYNGGYSAVPVDSTATIVNAAARLYAAEVGISGLTSDGEEFYKPSLVNPFNSTVTIGANGAVSCTAACFTVNDIGSTIVINGKKSVITSRTDASNILTNPQLSNDAPDNTPTLSWYCIRRNVTRSDQAKNTVYVTWTPPLGIFEHKMPLGNAQFHIQLQPNTNYAYNAIETSNPTYLLANTTPTATNPVIPYNITVNDLRFYACFQKMKIPDDTVLLQLREWQAMAQPLTQLTMSTNWTVPASTELMYVFLQTNNPNPARPPNRFIATNDFDLNLVNIQLTYGGVSLPPQQLTSGYQLSPASNGAANTAFANTSILQQLYYYNLLQLGKAFDPAGVEDYNLFLNRGPFYCFIFNKSADQRETEVQLKFTYGGPNSPTNGAAFVSGENSIFLIAEYRRTTEITSVNGSVASVRALNI